MPAMPQQLMPQCHSLLADSLLHHRRSHARSTAPDGIAVFMLQAKLELLYQQGKVMCVTCTHECMFPARGAASTFVNYASMDYRAVHC